MRVIVAGAIITTASFVAAAAWAEGPMTPVRPLSSPTGATQWVEPPPATRPASGGPATVSAPAANMAPAVAAAEAEAQAGQAPNPAETRTSRRSAGGSGGSTASRLNRQELARLRSGGQHLLFKHYASRLAYTPKARMLAVSAGSRSIELFDYPLRDAAPKEKERIQILLAQLDDDSYAAREAATKDLREIGILAEPDLRRAMKESPSTEVRIRCRRLLEEVLAKPKAKLAGDTGAIEGLAFSPDGQLLAAGGKGGAVCLWNVTNLKEVARLTPASP